MADKSLPSSVAEMTDILDIEEIHLFPWDKLILILLALSLIVFLALWLWRFLRKRLRKTKVLSPWEKALLQLKKLEGKGKGERERKAFYEDLSFLLKDFLEEAFSFPAKDKTTTEIEAAADKMPASIDGDGRGQILAFLKRADAIKFAGEKGSSEEALHDFELVKNLVGEGK